MKMCRTRDGEVVRGFHAQGPLSPHLRVFHNPVLWGCLGRLYYTGLTDELIGHWQLIQPPSPLPSPELREVGLKVLISAHGLVPMATSPLTSSLRCFPKVISLT